ncbi:MAG: G-D-S-L family lipolytic protein [Allomuricauda sp.]|nr:MAG: G-D-S-L family lipolytic protein [Allomuricauda sp.]
MRKILLVLVLGNFLAQAQNSSFADEVTAINKKYDTLWDASKPTIVFTGSSSIRLWKDLEERFPEHHILNTGFGGSEAYDLLVHLDDLVLKYNPKKVFIYEGDNDISNGKRPKPIIKTFETIISRIEEKNPEAQLVLISPKPSISRWKLKGKYKRLNKRLKKLAAGHDKLVFVDVWHIMLNGRKLNKTLFIQDGLHMNTSGYDLWYKQLKKHVNLTRK